jgi:hypothetical protein
MTWYQLFFQFEGIAEAWLQHDDWALLRELSRGTVISIVTFRICRDQML